MRAFGRDSLLARSFTVYLRVNVAEKEKPLRWIGAARWTYNDALEKADNKEEDRRVSRLEFRHMAPEIAGGLLWGAIAVLAFAFGVYCRSST